MNTIETQTEKIDLENTVDTIRTNTVDMNTIEIQTDLPFTAECPVCMEDGFKLKDLSVLRCGHYTCRPCGLRSARGGNPVNMGNGIEIRSLKCVICRAEDVIVKVIEAPPRPPAPPRRPAVRPPVNQYRYDPIINGLVLDNQPTPPVPQPNPLQPTPQDNIALRIQAQTLEQNEVNLQILDRLTDLDQNYKTDFRRYFSMNGNVIFIRDMARYITIPDNQPQMRFECIKFRAIIKTFLLTQNTNRPKCVNGNCRSNRGTQRKCPLHSIEIPCCLNCRTCCFCQNIQPRDQLRRRLGSRPTNNELRNIGGGVIGFHIQTLMGAVSY